jgi:hypothetical protein
MAPDGDEAFDLDMAAASLQSNSADVRVMLKLLVQQLTDVLGKRLSVERSGGLLRRSGEIRAVEIAMGDDVLRADLDGTSVRCTVAHSSGGIRIRREDITMDEWLKRLLERLQREAQHSEGARTALENIVIGRTP